MSDEDVNPWGGVDKDKKRHPRLGRFVDNIWVLALNRIVLPSLGAASIAVFTWGVSKVDTLNEVARDVPKLIESIKDVGDKLDLETKAQNIVIDHVKRAEEDISALKQQLSQDETAINASKSEAAAAAARVDDIKEDLKSIKQISAQNLAVSQSHDADIRATRNAVAPRATSPPF